MESEKRKGITNPWTRANFISRLFFWWLIPLLIKGRKGNLKLTDLYDCPEDASSEKNGNLLEKEWDKELQKRKSGRQPSLLRATIRTFGLECSLTFLLQVIQESICQVLQSILLGYLIQHFTRTNVLPKPYLYLTSVAFCLMPCSFVFFLHPGAFQAQRIFMKLRIACCSLIYKKALRLSQASLGRTTVGQMVNLLSNDVNRFDQVAPFVPNLVAAPLQAVVIICVLWMYVGHATFAGLIFLLLFITLQSQMGKFFSRLRKKTAVLTDERIRLMNEIIAGMRVIKMYGWEIPFADLVHLRRRKEIHQIRRTSFLRGVNLAAPTISSKIILVIVFSFYLMVVEGDLTPEKIFVCLSLLTCLDRALIFCVPIVIAVGAESLISLKRIQAFLLLEEKSGSDCLDVTYSRPMLKECGIWMKEVKASWNEVGEATLRDVTLTVKPGELLAVVGPVGCGKSSLLMSILGELPIISGELKVNGQMAYASQEPWVFGGSIMQNIVFGSDFDEAKYKKVLSICALNKDIALFPYGDQTAVGERGVILSGGQKARVSLARAMYFDADIFLLDDPLSAVDASVAKHLFEKCINGYLKDKVRILATHQIQFLKKVSRILVLKDGKCLTLGSYDDLIKAGIDLNSLVEENQQDTHGVSHQLVTSQSGGNPLNTECLSNSSKPVYEFESITSDNILVDDNNEEQCTEIEDTYKVPKIDEEMKSSGAVSRKVYKQYFQSGPGAVLAFVVIILFIATQAVFNGSDFWLAKWSGLLHEEHSIKNCWTGINETLLNGTGFLRDTFDHRIFKNTIANVSEDCFNVTRNYTKRIFDVERDMEMKFYLSIYSGLVLGCFLLSLIRTTAFFEMCMRTSISLHDKMFRSVLRSPIAFFDINPVGRILNRFSKDTGIIDDVLPHASHESIRLLFSALGIICVVSIVEPYLLLPTAVIITIVAFFRQFYLPTALDVKRYEGITRSPVFSHLSTSLYGLTTIRAFKVQRSFEISFDHHQDQHTATWFLFLSVTRCLSIFVDWLCLIYMIIVTIAVLITSERDKDPSYASSAGLAMVSAAQLMVFFQFSLKMCTDVENQMTSVERVIEYSKLEPEADLESGPKKQPPHNWPSEGNIVYKDVSLRYTPNEPPVLRNLNFEILPEEKIGIVGRTGAGKSSMVATLFRMTEPEGEIIVDGVCTKSIGLHDLRKKISIIPQDPILFTGPIRRNLDPFSEHSDTELWQSLEEAYLKESIKEMPGGLDSEVSEGGSNFSVGQRQLICLARAILRRNKILVLDEATANVDTSTDSLIQKTIRDRFARCTVLTVAHRLHTIMDSDRVLVYDAGKLKEFDEPYNLLQKTNGLFSQMVQKTGPIMTRQLHEVAFASHLSKLKMKCGEDCAYGKLDDNAFIKMNNLQTITGDIDNGACFREAKDCIKETFQNGKTTFLSNGCTNKIDEYDETTNL